MDTQFTSGFWDVYIAVITVVSIVACAVLLKTQSFRKAPGDADTTGHTWDEDLAEYNNPLPRWWSWLFYITIAFGLAYLVLYPGLGSWRGTLGWTEVGQYHRETEIAANWAALARPTPHPRHQPLPQPLYPLPPRRPTPPRAS